MHKKKGTLLIYILFVVLFVTVFLTAATFTMINTSFLTKKMVSENQAYWAATSGLEYVSNRLKSNINWPNGESLSGGEVSFGNYKITEKKEGDCYIIKGVCGEPNSENYAEFRVAFSNYAGSSIVPNSKPYGVEYYSYNNASIEKVLRDVIVSDTGKTEERSVTISPRGIYVVVDAQANASRCVIEQLLQVAANDGFDAAMYAGGNIDIGLYGEEAGFSVSQKGGDRPSICTNGSFSLKRDQAYTGGGTGCNLNDGTIYYKTNCEIFGQDVKEEAGLRRKSGILLNQMKEDLNFPRVSWGKIMESVSVPPASSKDDGFFEVSVGNTGAASAVMKAGTYVLIKDSAAPKGYSLFRFNNKGNQAFVDSDGNWLPNSPLAGMNSGNYSTNFENLGAEKVDWRKREAQTQTNDDGGVTLLSPEYMPIMQLGTDSNGNPLLDLKGTVHVRDNESATGLTLIALEPEGAGFKPLKTGVPQLRFSPILSSFGNNPIENPQPPPPPPDFFGDNFTASQLRATLSSEGPIIVKGRLRGVGRLVTGDDVSFETGSGVMGTYGEQEDRFAIYSKGSVKMTTLSQPDTGITVEIVKQAISGLSGGSEMEIYLKAIEKTFPYTLPKQTEETRTVKQHLSELGYTNSEISGILLKSIQINAKYQYDRQEHGPPRVKNITIPNEPYLPIPPPSSFKGVIYAWNDFIARSNNEVVGSSFSLNGVLVAFGGDPENTKMSPGDNGHGNILIDNCIDFNLTYDPSELENITKDITGYSPIRLTELLYNKII